MRRRLAPGRFTFWARPPALGVLESASDVHGPLCRVPLRCLPANLPCQVSAACMLHVRRAAYNNICYIRLKLNSALPVMLCLMSGGIVRKPGVSAISACSVRAGKVAQSATALASDAHQGQGW